MRTHGHIRFLAAACLVPALFAPAFAEETSDTLSALYMLRASSEVCDFELTDEQDKKLSAIEAATELAAKLDETASEAAYAAVKASVEKDKDALCAADGEWAKAYRASLSELDK